MAEQLGFILDPTCRVERGRAIVHLYGRLADGATFLVRDDRDVPCFYIPEREKERARDLGADVVRPCDLRSMRGEPLARVELALPSDAAALSERLIAGGVPCFEADVRFALRYLIDRSIRGAISIEGEFAKGERVERVFTNPRTTPASFRFSPRVLSIDIETDPAARRLLSIALEGCGVSEVLLYTPPGYSCPGGALPCASERELLSAFCQRVREIDPDVLTGWNVIDFDLAVLLEMARRLDLKLDLGRAEGELRIQPSPPGSRGTSRAHVIGRMVLDGIQLLRGSYVQMEEYSLDAVAREVLGEGKTVHGPGRASEIVRLFMHERERFVEYNRTDARLVIDILARLKLIELSVTRSTLTGMPLDRVSASIASFDFLYLSELHRRGLVGPGPASEEGEAIATSGGHVLSPVPGLFDNVLGFDYRSLYPSIMRTFQIDPLGFIAEPKRDPIIAPSGAAFQRGEPGILPQLLDELFPLRDKAKREGDAIKSHAIKILMNSFYGVLGASSCRFYNPELCNAITSFGRTILLWSKERIEALGYQVLYGDTDSLFVLSGCAGEEAALSLGKELVQALNRDLAEHIRRSYRVESRLELAFERLYLRFYLPRLRHAREGARKRYAGLLREGAERKVVFTGMEVVRSDWTELARQVQRELLRRLFMEEEVAEYLREVVRGLRAGELDHLLVYRKALRKDLSSYTATTPPHVAAARKLAGAPGRRISYVITQGGPEPVAELVSPIDHAHYIEKQLRPVAEPVLTLLGLDFAEIVGAGQGDRQLRLF